MGKRFWNNVKVTAPFFGLRLAFAFVISFAYIFIAAMIQYLFVSVMGETAFNYIVGGVMSLFLGIIFCHYIGALLFMLAKGWHVAALAYVPKIVKTGAPAVDVGIRAFNKNFVSFGVVYGVRNILKGVLGDFTDQIWSLTDDIPYGSTLKNLANNPIVEHIAKDILHYGFDATVFYLVRHPAKDLDDVPSTVMTAVKKYLYCLPTILVSSVSSYILFRVVPAILKWVVVIYAFFSKGIVAGILISVLMYPLFYILDNALFDPLTMILFITAYGRHCDEELSEDNPIVIVVNNIINGTDVGTSSKDFNDGSEEDEVEEEAQEPSDQTSDDSGGEESIEVTPEPVLSDVESEDYPEPDIKVPAPERPVTSGLGDLASMVRSMPHDEVVDYRIAGASVEDLPLDDDDSSNVESPMPDFGRSSAVPADDEDVNPVDIFSAFKGFSARDLNDGYIDEEESKPRDRAQSILLGDEDE